MIVAGSPVGRAESATRRAAPRASRPRCVPAAVTSASRSYPASGRPSACSPTRRPRHPCRSARARSAARAVSRETSSTAVRDPWLRQPAIRTGCSAPSTGSGARHPYCRLLIRQRIGSATARVGTRGGRRVGAPDGRRGENSNRGRPGCRGDRHRALRAAPARAPVAAPTPPGRCAVPTTASAVSRETALWRCIQDACHSWASIPSDAGSAGCALKSRLHRSPGSHGSWASRPLGRLGPVRGVGHRVSAARRRAAGNRAVASVVSEAGREPNEVSAPWRPRQSIRPGTREQVEPPGTAARSLRHPSAWPHPSAERADPILPDLPATACRARKQPSTRGSGAGAGPRETARRQFRMRQR